MSAPSLKQNFALNVAYQVLALVLPLVTSPYLSRVLGAANLGTYSYTYSVAYYFVLFAMLGVNNYGNREVARARADAQQLRRTFWSIWALQAALAALAVAAYAVYALALAEERTLALVWIFYVLSAALDVNWLFFGLERFRVTVGRNFAVKLATFAITFLVVRGQNALFNYVALMSASLCLSVAVLWPFVLRDVPPARVRPREVAAHIRPNLVLFVPVVAVSIYNVMDKVMLGQLSTMEQTGFYENSYKVACMPFTLVTALGTVMMPRASSLLAKGRRDEAKAYMAPSMWMATLLSAAFAFGIAAVAEEFAPVFFGAGFEPCSEVMCVIVAAMPFMAWANVIRTQYLIPAGRDREYVVSVVAGACVNVAVNLVAIPALGALGAGLGTLAAEAAVCIVQTAAVREELPIKTWLLDAVPGFAIGAAMFFVVRASVPLLPGGAVGLVLEVLVGAAFFTAASAVWFGLTRNAYAERLVFSTVRRAGVRLAEMLRGGAALGNSARALWGARSSWHAAYDDRALVVAAC